MLKLLGLPTWFYPRVQEIDFNQLKNQGIRTLFFDLDNTLISYKDLEITGEKEAFLKGLSEIFDVYIVSNNREKRVKRAVAHLGFHYLSGARKPYVYKVKKWFTKHNISLVESCIIGDQVGTDIKLANRLGMKSILVLPILKSSDHFWTKLSRFLAQKYINKVKKLAPDLYEERLKLYDEYR